MGKQKPPKHASKFFREMDKKAAVSDAEKARIATLQKTEKLKKLRLVKEAEERAAEVSKPAKKKI